MLVVLVGDGFDRAAQCSKAFGGEFVQVGISNGMETFIAVLGDAGEDHGVCSLAVELDLPFAVSDDNGHALADVVEVENAKQIVRLLLTVYLQSIKLYVNLLSVTYCKAPIPFIFFG